MAERRVTEINFPFSPAENPSEDLLWVCRKNLRSLYITGSALLGSGGIQAMLCSGNTR